MNKLTDEISNKGLGIFRLEDTIMHDEIRDRILNTFNKVTNKSLTDLNAFHEHINIDDINDIRLKLAAKLNEESYASDVIFEHSKKYIKELLGPDVAIQKNVGLSIQIPKDKSSLLHIHSDVYDSDCSPYELVIWIPLVKCYKTKSMFYLPFESTNGMNEYLSLSKKLRNNLNSPEKVTDMLQYIKAEPPDIAIFSHSIWHGNQVNETNETRFSINVRVKNIFTPYRGKKLGDFFKIAELSRISKIASEVELIINE